MSRSDVAMNPFIFLQTVNAFFLYQLRELITLINDVWKEASVQGSEVFNYLRN